MRIRDKLAINISFKIIVLKPLHVKWLGEFYNHITSGEKREIITRGFERAGITHALELGSSKLPELDCQVFNSC